MLRLADVRAGYGSALVLSGLTLEVEEGEIAVVLGANGVGKTTALRTIGGLLRPWTGAITFEGRRIERMSPDRVVRLGIGTVPPPPGIFRDLTVADNLRIGGFALGRDRPAAARRIEEILSAFPLLRDRAGQTAGSLSGGEQRQLALARALMGRPRLLLVDEVSIGLSPLMVSMVFGMLRRVREDGVTVLMAEQNVSALDHADRAYVLEKGRVVREDRGTSLAWTRAEAARTYLGAGRRR